jgi:pyruvate/2-oxoglutarate/acetoin dehydrogenase E1 component
MKYKKAIINDMRWIGRDPKVKFIGYNTERGHQMYGTLKGCEKSCIETPIAENLMVGLAMGMSLEGYYPVVCFERSNFLLPALDAMPRMAKNFDFPVLLRVIIPTNTPLNPGIQHLGDFTDIIKNHTKIKVVQYSPGAYKKYIYSQNPICIVEHKEKYETDCSSRIV